MTPAGPPLVPSAVADIVETSVSLLLLETLG